MIWYFILEKFISFGIGKFNHHVEIVKSKTLTDEEQILDYGIPMKLIFVPEGSTKNHSKVMPKSIQIILLVRVDSICLLHATFIVEDSVEGLL